MMRQIPSVVETSQLRHVECSPAVEVRWGCDATDWECGLPCGRRCFDRGILVKSEERAGGSAGSTV